MAVFQLSCKRPEQKLIKVNERFLLALMALDKDLYELSFKIQYRAKNLLSSLPSWETSDTGSLNSLSKLSLLVHPGPYPCPVPQNISIFNMFIFKSKSC